MSESILRRSPGSRDADEPFDDFLCRQLERTYLQLASMGVANPHWDLRRKVSELPAGSPSAIVSLALVSVWLREALTEEDPNRRLHLAWQASREATLAEAGRRLAPDVLRARTDNRSRKFGGASTKKSDTAAIIAELNKAQASAPNLSERAICSRMAQKRMPKGTKKEIQKLANGYRSRWRDHRKKLADR